ncbi:MAG: hypothetical protein WDW36_005879 [Sanguina aurantia]
MAPTDNKGNAKPLRTAAGRETVANQGAANSKQPGNARTGARKPRSNSELDAVQSKQQLLAHLTRAADENSRILDRERAAMQAMGITSMDTQGFDIQEQMQQQQQQEGYPQQQQHQEQQQLYEQQRQPYQQQYGSQLPYQQQQQQQQPQPQQQGQAQPGLRVAVPAHALHQRLGRGNSPLGQNQARPQAAPSALGRPAQKSILSASPHNRLAKPVENKRTVVDPTQVPGLSVQEPQSPFAAFHDNSTPNSQGLGSTFPDSPGFFPGMVFSVPGGLSDPPSRQQQQQQQRPNGQQQGQQQQQQQQSPQQQQQLQQQQAQQQQQQQQQQAPQQQHEYRHERGKVQQNPEQRAEVESKQEAFRRDLQEQIQAKKEFKAREVAAQKREDQKMAAAAESHPQPWDPAARAVRVGGGGDPLRGIAGNTVADLRCQRNGNPVASAGLPVTLTGSPGSQGAYARPGQQASAHPLGLQLSIDIPNHGNGNASWGGPEGEASFRQQQQQHQQGQQQQQHQQQQQQQLYQRQQQQQQQQFQQRQQWQQQQQGNGDGNGMYNSPASHQQQQLQQQQLQQQQGSPNVGHPSPGHGSGSPRFVRSMAAPNDLRAGPSEEQRRTADAQRTQLQNDLQEQIRYKADKKAAEKAAEERERRKVSAPNASSPSYPNPTPAAPPAPAHDEPAVRGRLARQGSKSRLVDASWLDKTPNTMGMSPVPESSSPYASASPPLGGGNAMAVRRSATADPGAGGGAPGCNPRPHSPQQLGRGSVASLPPLTLQHPRSGMAVAHAPGPAGSSTAGPGSSCPRGGGGMGVGVSREMESVLAQVREDQARMRTEMTRQTETMTKLAGEAARAASDRDVAWSELGRVRQLLHQGEHVTDPGPSRRHGVGRSSLLSDVGSLSHFVVATHLVPKTISMIPEALPPSLLEGPDWLTHGQTDPGPQLQDVDPELLTELRRDLAGFQAMNVLGPSQHKPPHQLHQPPQQQQQHHPHHQAPLPGNSSRSRPRYSSGQASHHQAHHPTHLPAVTAPHHEVGFGPLGGPPPAAYGRHPSHTSPGPQPPKPSSPAILRGDHLVSRGGGGGVLDRGRAAAGGRSGDPWGRNGGGGPVGRGGSVRAGEQGQARRVGGAGGARGAAAVRSSAADEGGGTRGLRGC